MNPPTASPLGNETIILTRASGSLGLGIVQRLLNTSSYRTYTLILTLRNPNSIDQYTQKLQSLISKHASTTTTYIEPLDLGDFSSIRTFTEGINKKVQSGELPPIASLILNAFTWSLSQGLKFAPKAGGYEETFAVNHLGNSLLTLLLLQSMSNAPASAAGARIV